MSFRFDRAEAIDRYGFSKCHACGAWCDGGVCDWRCESDLIAEREAAEQAAHDEAGESQCDWCGEWRQTDALVVHEDDLYCPPCVQESETEPS